VDLCDAYGPDTATTLAEVPYTGEDELVQWLKKRKARPRRGPRPPQCEGAHAPESNAAAIQADADTSRAEGGECPPGRSPPFSGAVARGDAVELGEGVVQQ